MCETKDYGFSILPIERESADELDESDNGYSYKSPRFKLAVTARRLSWSFTLPAVEEERTVCTSDCSRVCLLMQ